VFARVGARAEPDVSPGRVPPQIGAHLISERGGLLRLQVTNRSQIPQPQLQLYAVTPGAGRTTAAGSTTVSQLGAGQTVTARLTLIGRPAGSPELEALPTLFLP
jgi:hypothetical protein